jgi:hypothetical protein
MSESGIVNITEEQSTRESLKDKELLQVSGGAEMSPIVKGSLVVGAVQGGISYAQDKVYGAPNNMATKQGKRI